MLNEVTDDPDVSPIEHFQKPPFLVQPSDYGDGSILYRTDGCKVYVMKPNKVRRTSQFSDLLIELDGFNGGAYSPEQMTEVGFMLIQAAITARRFLKNTLSNQKKKKVSQRNKGRDERRRKYLMRELAKLEKK